MFPISRYVPPSRSICSPSGTTAGRPTTSTTMSAPRFPVSSFTFAMRSVRLLSAALMSITSSAPNRFASSSRLGTPSMAITASAPISFATAIAFSPRPPAPWIDDRVAVAHARLLQPVRHLRQRAVHRRRHLVGDLVRHLEDPAARLQVVVLAVRAAELADARPHRQQLVRAGRELALVALVAAVAGSRSTRSRRGRLPSAAARASPS